MKFELFLYKNKRSENFSDAVMSVLIQTLYYQILTQLPQLTPPNEVTPYYVRYLHGKHHMYSGIIQHRHLPTALWTIVN